MSTKVHLFLFLAAILFIIAILTDFLDGYLARKNNLISNFGKL
ncbi:CDP-alcohol phosphatidyltransferase family protein [bacterium]|nr:CDP-alcohol phosphatidyltransferase family protein [bacterium]